MDQNSPERPEDAEMSLLSSSEACPTDAAERLQLALDAGAIIGTWVWDIPNDRVTADDRFSHTFDIPLERCLAGIPISEAFASVHPDDLARLAQEINETMARGGAFRCEYRVRHDDGHYRWVEANGRAELNSERQAVRFPGVLMNIESRKQAEAERDRAMALLKTFTAAVPGVVYAKDLYGRILIANDGATQLIGKPPEFYLGKTDLEILEDKAQARQVMETDQRIMRSGIAEQIEEQVNMPDGSAVIWLSAKAPLLDESGAVVGLVGSSIDVTARKSAEAALLELNHHLEARIADAMAEREAVEAALRQAQKMEAIGQLTGGIAHDFNNLLAGIAGSLDLIRMRLHQGRISEVERYVSVAKGAVQRAASLTHRLLAFSRRQTLMPVQTDVHVLIADMEELIRRTVGPAINLKVDLGAASPVCVVDAAQVENSLLNLCINARDALTGTGNIAITTFNQTLMPETVAESDIQPGRFLTICVADDGAGMPPETLAKAVDPFFTTKPVGAGTGLGLSMVYGFAKQSGGQLKIESKEGSGTRVFLQLPSSEEVLEAPDAQHTSTPIPIATPDTILVVDDEPTVRMFVGEALSGIGYTVIEAVDGLAGLQLLQSDTRIDLLITDIGLPGGMDGRELAKAGRECRPMLPVLFMTGYAEPRVLPKFPHSGSTGLLTKPFSLEILTIEVNSLLHHTAEQAE
ncbi:PAS domain-containing protein [Pseudomonas sp. NPDC090208]|uniref:hybrid sensor histidine kinase/response regulator n=1 Tax=Pseudomonas sp. NPDC090208 TaxID=3364478 RepID=UPI0037F58EC2